MADAGRASEIKLITDVRDTATQDRVAAQANELLKAEGVEVTMTRTLTTFIAQNNIGIDMVIFFLLLMAVLLAAVGGLGLMGTMSINVLERTREIGVMRAIGASDRAVRQIVLSEGLATATLAWLIGTLLSLPMSYAMCYVFGKGLLNSPLIWSYALPAVAMWLGISLLIGAVASLWPARAAVRLTVREVLAYE
jgi:ABC-type transport system, involved in lipoprotein release, permease component